MTRNSNRPDSETQRLKAIAKRLRDIRESKGLTRKQVSISLDISEGAIYQHERQNNPDGMSETTLFNYCRLYNVKSQEILGY